MACLLETIILYIYKKKSVQCPLGCEWLKGNHGYSRPWWCHPARRGWLNLPPVGGREVPTPILQRLDLYGSTRWNPTQTHTLPRDVFSIPTQKAARVFEAGVSSLLVPDLEETVPGPCGDCHTILCDSQAADAVVMACQHTCPVHL